MARIVRHETLCDYGDGKEATTTRLTLDGRTVEIDLCEHDRARLEEKLDEVFAHGRRPTGPTPARGRPRTASSAHTERHDRAAYLAKVRAWAGEQGIEVGERGRVPQKVLDAYEQAN